MVDKGVLLLDEKTWTQTWISTAVKTWTNPASIGFIFVTPANSSLNALEKSWKRFFVHIDLETPHCVQLRCFYLKKKTVAIWPAMPLPPSQMYSTEENRGISGVCCSVIGSRLFHYFWQKCWGHHVHCICEIQRWNHLKPLECARRLSQKKFKIHMNYIF